MPHPEQRERMRLMREIVRSRNVYRWAGQMLLDAAQLRKHQKIMLMGSQESGSTVIKGRRFKRAKAG
jgi:trehalose 6-phosphate synthase